MSTKTCPYCSEAVLASAKKCKHCGEFLDRNLRRVAEARSKREFPHIKHLIVTVLTCGLWFPCWMLMAICRDRRVYR